MAAQSLQLQVDLILHFGDLSAVVVTQSAALLGHALTRSLFLILSCRIVKFCWA
jgi:hypothetical protein